jgi:hypothetical protein
MNRSFDYNGTIVGPSNPVKKLKTVKKFLIIDSGDRDIVKFPDNGDLVIYLPRVYENVISLRLAGAEFPDSEPIIKTTGATISPTNLYFLLDIEGLNKTDECSVGADRSGYPDSTFAKIPFGQQVTDHIFYNDHSAPENVAHYRPAIGKLDRMHIRTRLHSQKSNSDFVYWGEDKEYSLTFEIEYLENVFDDFSQFETRISDRA